ncbi:uncharacterized protein BXZ73DRAFT_51828 [Epithele typhae]|uniref:uncharacterized protein n=1 Tax=Epithele typhae TaxID=378194 RepID=UPI00200851A4|nr:uncharacterized protein BXZ73DRAFT_51828 [Epithele typhae]KAH9921478.1 hypothetical protein BXZ73DRAFT_51828 [Epithele typhae]
MDFSEEYSAAVSEPPLPYDDPIPAEDVAPATMDSIDPTEAGPSLADRIGATKVYLVSDASKSKGGKRKRDDDDEGQAGDVDMEERDDLVRENAILLRGTPISHLPTSNIFAYVSHFDAHLLGLEWIDDTTCVLVFESKTDARTAFRALQKSSTEDPSPIDDMVTAKSVPMGVWPAEHRIKATLPQASESPLKETVRMRWARPEDVKKRGAKKESQFYRKYGEQAGKTFDEGPSLPKRRRPAKRGPVVDADERAALDAELDSFLAEDDDDNDNGGRDAQSLGTTSRMRSDHMGNDGRSLLERTSIMRAHPEEERPTASLPRRARGRRGAGDWFGDLEKMELGDRLADAEPEGHWRGGRPRGGRDRGTGRRGRRPPRSKVTQEDLDAELDAFLKGD